MLNFSWAFADAGSDDGIPPEAHWNDGTVKKKTRVISLHLAFVKFVKEQTDQDDVRVRLFFKLERIKRLKPLIFIDPDEDDDERFIECSPVWINSSVDELLNDVDECSLLVSTKIGDQPWSWEVDFNHDYDYDHPKLGIIYDVKKSECEWYQAFPFKKTTDNKLIFRFIGLDKDSDQEIAISELSKYVSPRGTHTNGYYKRVGTAKKLLFLYPPYPKPTIVENKRIKLSTFFQIIPIIVDNAHTLKSRDEKTDNDL